MICHSSLAVCAPSSIKKPLNPWKPPVNPLILLCNAVARVWSRASVKEFLKIRGPSSWRGLQRRRWAREGSAGPRVTEALCLD